MAAAVVATHGAGLCVGPSATISRATGLSASRSLLLRPAGAFRPTHFKLTAPLRHRAALQSSNGKGATSFGVRCATEEVKSEESQKAPSAQNGLPAGLTISAAVCLMEMFATGVAEAKHAPQVDAGAFFTSLTVDGLIEWTATVVAFVVFYFAIAPPVLLTYFMRRWKKKQLAETFFMFCLVFVFFPGLMVWAPFINTRAFPRSTGRYTAETDKKAFRGEEWRQP